MTHIVLTYEDFAALPDDGHRYELHEGELSVTPAPGARHQEVLLNLALLLTPYVRAHTAGKLFIAPFDCIMANIRVVERDLLYIDETRRQLLSERALEGAPTLAVEVLSPWTGHIDRRRKMTLYAKHGVEWYWIVDPPARAIDVYRLAGEDYRHDARLEGEAPRALPPFSDLPPDPFPSWA